MVTPEFSVWLQAELEHRGWDQAELARRSEVTPAQISRILSQTRRPGPDACLAIARALRVPPEEVFRRAGLLPPTGELDPAVRELTELLPLLNHDDLRVLIRFAQGMLHASAEGRPRTENEGR